MLPGDSHGSVGAKTAPSRDPDRRRRGQVGGDEDNKLLSRNR